MSTAAHCRLSLLELPGRFEAELALKAASKTGQRAFAALFVADRILTLSEQFGYVAGDQMLLDFSSYWLTALPREDKLYRWSGTAFLAVINRAANWRDLAAEIDRLAAQPVTAWLQAQDGRTPIVLGSRVQVLPVEAHESPAAMIRSIDFFVGTNVG
jgi:GGDEF domain-containing protein